MRHDVPTWLQPRESTLTEIENTLRLGWLAINVGALGQPAPPPVTLFARTAGRPQGWLARVTAGLGGTFVRCRTDRQPHSQGGIKHKPITPPQHVGFFQSLRATMKEITRSGNIF